MTVTTQPSIAAIAIGYPEGPLSEALEDAVQQSLPRLPGLEEAKSAAERLVVYSKTVQAQREQFIGVYGDAFGSQPLRLLHGEGATRAHPVHRAHAAGASAGVAGEECAHYAA